MKVTRAVITAAGRQQRHLPLQTVIDRQGYPQTVLHLFLEELVDAGIEQVALVVRPGDTEVYREAAGDHAARLTFVPQDEPLGFAHAVWCARDFYGEGPFLLMVSDHLFVSDDPDRSCVRQLLAAAEKLDCAVSAVEATHESKLAWFGAVGGRLFDQHAGTYTIERVVEKPTPTQAEEELLVPGLRRAHYLCFFGMHVLPSGFATLLDELIEAPGLADRKPSLSVALNRLPAQARYLAIELAGRRYDLEQAYGFLIAQMALALEGEDRETVLTSLVELLARTRR